MTDEKTNAEPSGASGGSVGEVVIGGVRYVPADQHPTADAMKLLAEVYGALWCEAGYDPKNKITQEFAAPLADKMRKANQTMKFKT